MKLCIFVKFIDKNKSQLKENCYFANLILINYITKNKINNEGINYCRSSK